jgi:hypothetical protein
MLELRERRQRAALIASLSPQALAAGTDFAREATDSFLVAIASELATVRKEIDEKVADVEDDCKQKRTMIRDLREAPATSCWKHSAARCEISKPILRRQEPKSAG